MEHVAMNPSPTQTPTRPLDPAAVAAMQSATIDALPPRPSASEAEKADQRAGAFAFLAALRPRDLMEATLATRIVSLHYAAMECLRRAARDSLPTDLHLRTVGKAVALCRMMDGTTHELRRCQAGRVGQPAGLAAVLPALGTAPQPQAAPGVVRASTPVQPPVMEGRHERRHRERAERHLASAVRAAGLPKGALENAMQQRARAEVAARVAGAAMAVAA
jgi:hypothetical protein